MPFAMPGLTPNIESILRQRMMGQGMGLSAYDDARTAALADMMAGYDRSRTQAIGQQAMSGTGRSGASGALLAGLGMDQSRAAGNLSGQFGTQRAQAMNQGIESALGMGLTLEQLQQQAAQFQQQMDYQRGQDQPGWLETLGGVAGLGAGLFGAGGAFPHAIGGLGHALGGLFGGGQSGGYNFANGYGMDQGGFSTGLNPSLYQFR